MIIQPPEPMWLHVLDSADALVEKALRDGRLDERDFSLDYIGAARSWLARASDDEIAEFGNSTCEGTTRQAVQSWLSDSPGMRAEILCEEVGLNPDATKVHSWHIVSESFVVDLKHHGELVIELDGIPIWGNRFTGKLEETPVIDFEFEPKVDWESATR